MLSHSSRREVGLIPDILATQERYAPEDPQAYLESVYAARSIFLNPPPIPAGARLVPREPQDDLEDVLIEFGILARRAGVSATTSAVLTHIDEPDYVFTLDDVDVETALSCSPGNEEDDQDVYYDALEEQDYDGLFDDWDSETEQEIFDELDRLTELHIRQ
jgi:hypothetical protein